MTFKVQIQVVFVVVEYDCGHVVFIQRRGDVFICTVVVGESSIYDCQSHLETMSSL